jgi:Lipid A 3-O-deacylase (PagL)
MQKALAYIRQLVGNGKAATIGIFIFILVLSLLFWRPSLAASVSIAGGSSFGAEGTGPVLGLSIAQPITPNQNLALVAGTDLWGSTTFHNSTVPNNWDWHAGVESCRWRICASIGAAYVQRVDAINGAHTNYNLGLRFKISPRLSIVLGHISDAGTTNPNTGRQALSIAYRLQ